jgi:hypothetical protein
VLTRLCTLAPKPTLCAAEGLREYTDDSDAG